MKKSSVGPKSPHKKVLGVSTKIWSIHMSFFYLTSHMSGKILILSYGPKISRPIRVQDSFNYKFLQRSWGMKLNFCMWLYIHRSNKFSQVLQVDVIRHVRVCPTCQGMPKVKPRLRLSWAITFFFVCSLESTEVTKLFNHLAVDVIRYAQSDWKQLAISKTWT